MRRLLVLARAILRLLENQRTQTQGGVDTDANSGDKVRTATEPAVVELHIPQAAMEQYVATNKAQNELEQRKLGVETRKERTDRRRLVIERLTLAFAVLATVGAFLNLKLLKDSLTASNKAATAATDAAMVANDSLVIENRPWLVVTRSTSGLGRDGTALVTATLTNIGQTPAKHVNGCIRVQVLTSGQSPDFDYTPGKGNACYQYSIPVVNPRAPAVPLGDLAALEPTRDGKPVIVDRNLAAAIINGEANIVISGRLSFKDVFNIDHWIQFCEWVVGENSPIRKQGEMQPGRFTCSAYNDLDSNTRQGQPSQ